jgi:hypothetical protein
MSTSKLALESKLITIFSSPSSSPADLTLKASEIAAAIDEYVEDVFSKATATGTSTSPSGAGTCNIPPGGMVVN